MKAVFAIAALLLAGVVGRELVDAAAPLPLVAVPGRLPPALPPHAAATAAAGAADALAAAQTALLGRPLFSPDRRPAADAAASAGARAGAPRLAGVLIDPSARRAILADGTHQTVLTEGGVLGAWRVATIAAGQVTLLGPEGMLTLHPAFAVPLQTAPEAASAPRPAPADRPLAQPK
jgi:hypothetical protein